MELVHIVECEHVDVGLDAVNRIEVTAHVEMCATVVETRGIGDGACRKSHYGTLLYRQRLADGLDAIENTCRRSSLHEHAVGINSDLVAFCGFTIDKLEHYALGCNARNGLELIAKLRSKIVLEELSVALHVGIAGSVTDLSSRVEHKWLTALCECDALRHRDDVVTCLGCRSRCALSEQANRCHCQCYRFKIDDHKINGFN